MGPRATLESVDAIAAKLDVIGVGVSIRAQPAHASNSIAALVEDQQFVLGEGPIVEAFQRARLIEAYDTAHGDAYGWLQLDLRRYGVGSAFAFPIVVTDTCLGALTLYCAATGNLSSAERSIAWTAACSVAFSTLR